MLGEGGVTDLKPWGRWATLGLGFIALFGGQIVALTALVWWNNLSLARLSDLTVDGVLVSLSLYIGTAIQVALLVLMTRKRGAGAAAYLGLTLPRKRDLILGIITVTVFTAAADAIGRLFTDDLVTQFQLDIYRTANAAGWLPGLGLALIVVAPIGEETLFRGFLFRGWCRLDRDTWVAIIATALLWALVHVQYNLYLIAQIFLYGLVLGWFRWKSGSTILTILLHSLVNIEGIVGTVIAVLT
jgi:membrane protease YdiL (CAAX protease family)